MTRISSKHCEEYELEFEGIEMEELFDDLERIYNVDAIWTARGDKPHIKQFIKHLDAKNYDRYTLGWYWLIHLI